MKKNIFLELIVGKTIRLSHKKIFQKKMYQKRDKSIQK